MGTGAIGGCACGTRAAGAETGVETVGVGAWGPLRIVYLAVTKFGVLFVS